MQRSMCCGRCYRCCMRCIYGGVIGYGSGSRELEYDSEMRRLHTLLQCLSYQTYLHHVDFSQRGGFIFIAQFQLRSPRTVSFWKVFAQIYEAAKTGAAARSLGSLPVVVLPGRSGCNSNPFTPRTGPAHPDLYIKPPYVRPQISRIPKYIFGCRREKCTQDLIQPGPDSA